MVEAGELLEEHKGKENYKELVESITRILNITKTNGEMGPINKQLLETDSEKELVDVAAQLSEVFTETADANQRYTALENIYEPITEFFDHNMVMVEELEIKENRLALLNNLANITMDFADFSQLIV